MKKPLLIVFLVIVIYFLWPGSTVQGPSSEHEFKYIVRVSADGGASDTLPMVISLHGDGGCPEDFYKYLLKDIDTPARFVMLQGPKSFYGKFGWPRMNGSLQEYGDAIADATSVLLDKFPTVGKPIVVGFSSGGSYSYYLAAYHGNLFSYIFPLAGNLPPELMKTDTATYSDGAKVIAFHGKKDSVIGFAQGASALESLRQRGLEVEMVPYDGDHRDIVGYKKLVYDRMSKAMSELY